MEKGTVPVSWSKSGAYTIRIDQDSDGRFFVIDFSEEPVPGFEPESDPSRRSFKEKWMANHYYFKMREAYEGN